VTISRGSDRKERSRKRKFNIGLEKSGRVEIKGKRLEKEKDEEESCKP